MALDVSTFVQINTRVSAGGVPRPDFGRGLLVTVDDTLPAGGSGKIEAFADINGINTAFASGSQRSDAATWFGADPPPRPLYIGRWANADVSTTLLGGTPAAVADLTAANSTFVLNGITVTANLSSGATYSDKAALIQTAVQTGFSGATFTYSASGFLLTLAGAGEIAGGALASTAVGSDTDLAPLLGMDSGSSPTYKQGSDQETIVEAIETLNGLAGGSQPVVPMLGSDVLALATADALQQSVAAWAQGGDYAAAILDTSGQALVAGDTTSLSAQAFALQQSQVAAVYSRASTRPDIALMALMSAQNLDQPSSVVSPHGKALPGAAPSDITFTQLGELERKRVNVYTNVGGLPSLVGGYAANSSYWLDASWWLLWMKSRLETAIWSSLRGSNRLTNAILQDTISNAAEAGVRNGGIQPGRRVDNATKADIIRTTGNVEFSGVLTTGWLLWIESDAEQSDADRAARHGRFKLYVSGSEAIHRVTGSLVFSG